MSPPLQSVCLAAETADPANTALAEEAFVPERLLEEGEIVILAIKPAVWFILLVSWRVLVAAAIFAAGGYLLGEAIGISHKMVLLISLAAACIRGILASCQWLGRLYVLTNRRLLRISGVFRTDIFACSLRKVRQVSLHANAGERALGLGSLLFVLGADGTPGMSWTNISRPEEVHEIVSDAIRRAS